MPHLVNRHDADYVGLPSQVGDVPYYRVRGSAIQARCGLVEEKHLRLWAKFEEINASYGFRTIYSSAAHTHVDDGGGGRGVFTR